LNPSTAITEEPQGINIKSIFHLVLRNWYWYTLSLIFCSVCGWVYLRYTPAVYTVSASLLIKEDKNKIGGAENFLDGLELLSSSRNVQNEIELIRSFSNISEAIKELNFDVSYFEQGNIKVAELYNLSPFQVKLDTNFTQVKNKPIYITILSDSTFSIHSSHTENTSSDHGVVCKFGEHCHSNNYSFIIHKTKIFSSAVHKNTEYYFIINDVEDLSHQYSAKLNIDLVDKKSSVLKLSMSGLLPVKESDFLNKLCEVYIESGLEEKNQTAVNTIYFIDNQLNQITDSLQGAENKLERFRSNEKIMDLGSAATNAVNQLDLLEKERAELIVKDRYYHYLLDYLSYDYDIKKIIAPSAMGIQDAQLNNLIAELHILNTEKTSLGFSTQSANPAVNILELKIDNTKKSLIETLKNIIKASEIAINDNQNRLNRIQLLINKLPSNERSLVNIQRKFLLNENIYNYLMQKRIEAGIAKAANLADNKIINKALVSGKKPVSPKKQIVIMICLVIGLLIPSIILYIRYSLNDTITSREMIEQSTKCPIIGSIAHNSQKNQLPIITASKSAISESIRSLRINLQYLAADKKNKVIGISSSISGEGKTFFSSNLAASIALSGTKVVIVGTDLRKPKLHHIFNTTNDLGLSNYYINQASIQDIIKSTSIPKLDLITSGPVPPNPTELLESAKTDELFSFLKKEYECIIIDAPPVGLVSDYYLLSKYIDADLYLVRQNHTPKALLKDINSVYKNNKLPNMFIVFNDVKYNTGYGYQYEYKSYGYYDDTPEKPTLTGSIVSGIKKLFKLES
jgi:capsular exopolysaccharide synthesis family protein